MDLESGIVPERIGRRFVKSLVQCAERRPETRLEVNPGCFNSSFDRRHSVLEVKDEFICDNPAG